MDDGAEQLCVARPGLPLPTATEVAASGYDDDTHHNCEDGREAGREACPVKINEGKAVVGLVKSDVRGFVVGVVLDGKVRLVVELLRRRRGGRGC